MKTLSQAETPFSQVLLNWATDRISRTMTAIRPKHRAGADSRPTSPPAATPRAHEHDNAKQ